MATHPQIYDRLSIPKIGSIFDVKKISFIKILKIFRESVGKIYLNFQITQYNNNSFSTIKTLTNFKKNAQKISHPNPCCSRPLNQNRILRRVC